MNYPKPIMSISELATLGFSARELNEYAHIANQNFTMRNNAGKKGKILFDTEEFEKWRLKHTSV